MNEKKGERFGKAVGDMAVYFMTELPGITISIRQNKGLSTFDGAGIHIRIDDGKYALEERIYLMDAIGENLDDLFLAFARRMVKSWHMRGER
jgi:hypothetical protein